MHRKLIILLVFFCNLQVIAFAEKSKDVYIVSKKAAWPIIIEENANVTVKLAARLFAQDIERISAKKPEIIKSLPSKKNGIIIAGQYENSALIQHLVQSGKHTIRKAAKEWEGFTIDLIRNPFKGIDYALVITGSHQRGVAFGLLHISEMYGVSPWYWWADVPVKKFDEIAIASTFQHDDFPKVKYRGIFLNDEAPALSNWSKEKFGGFNHKFYEKIFELMLRLKSNYIWPAMWGNAFYDDDSMNIHKAHEYGIVIGTSHHEPLMRAHDEWRRYGKGKWNYDSNELRLKEFWKAGMQRGWNEKIVSVGMRGDGDEPMSRETATTLLEKIVSDQRKIIEEVTGKPAEQTPQLWALYKEVQDYYDKGMRVPDDVTLLLCDDNWGNIRRLPALNEKPRKGGYGIYYHFDYVGGPRNYKWINTNHISRIWEQMHLAYQYQAKEIWIVNVGDLKPMEFPISFFLDYAWNPDMISQDYLMDYTRRWVSLQFDGKHTAEIAQLIDGYTKINSRRKPELLDARTYSFNYYEWDRVVQEYDELLKQAEKLKSQINPLYLDAYYQLVLHPIKASSNLYQLYYAVALNAKYASEKDTLANNYANEVKVRFENDSIITSEYHALNKGKWNHIMSQTHIGYTYWQQPPHNKMPEVEKVETSLISMKSIGQSKTMKSSKNMFKPLNYENLFYEHAGMASIYPKNFTRKFELADVKWQVLPGHGRTGDAITTFPVTHKSFEADHESPWLEFDVYNYSDPDSIKLHLYFSPTLNFQHLPGGLQYEVSINHGPAQRLSINKNDSDIRAWESWVSNNVILSVSTHAFIKKEKQTIRYRPLNPGMVLQKIVIDFGELLPTYLGPEETKF
jgi:hypothetical protein